MDAFYPPPAAFDSSFNGGRTGSERRLMAAPAMNSLKQSESRRPGCGFRAASSQPANAENNFSFCRIAANPTSAAFGGGQRTFTGSSRTWHQEHQRTSGKVAL